MTAFAGLWFGYYATVGIFNPYAPLWFKDLGHSTLAIGAIAAMQAWTRIVAPYAWGWMGDHGGQRVRLLRLAAAGVLLAALALPFVRSYPAVALATVLIFVANGGVVPLTEALLAQRLSTPGGVDPARYGRIRVWGSLGFISSVVAAGAALSVVGIGFFPWFVVLLAALLLAATLLLPRQHDDDERALHAGTPAPLVLAVLRKPEVAWFFGSIFFTVLAHMALYIFFSLYLDALGYPKWAVGLLWGVSIVVEIVFFWFQGAIFPLLPPYGWLQLAALLSALRFGATAAFAASALVLVLAQLLHAVTFAAQHAACIVVISRHFGGRLRGRGQALYTVLGYGVSGVLGGIGGGWLSDRLGFAAVFWAGAGCALLGLACARTAAARQR